MKTNKSQINFQNLKTLNMTKDNPLDNNLLNNFNQSDEFDLKDKKLIKRLKIRKLRYVKINGIRNNGNINSNIQGASIEYPQLNYNNEKENNGSQLQSLKLKNIQIDDINSNKKGISTIEKLCKEIDREYNNICNQIVPNRTNSEYEFNNIVSKSPNSHFTDENSYSDLRGNLNQSFGNHFNPSRTLIMNKYLESIFKKERLRTLKGNLILNKFF